MGEDASGSSHRFQKSFSFLIPYSVRGIQLSRRYVKNFLSNLHFYSQNHRGGLLYACQEALHMCFGCAVYRFWITKLEAESWSRSAGCLLPLL